MPYHYYHQKAYFCGNVIFSKYPLSPVKDETDFSKERDYGAVAEVNAGEKGKFLVICTHLVSFRLTKEEVTMLSEPGNTKEEVQEYLLVKGLSLQGLEVLSLYSVLKSQRTCKNNTRIWKTSFALTKCQKRYLHSKIWCLYIMDCLLNLFFL